MKTSTHTSSIAATRVNGTEVYNPTGDHLGEIDDIMIDKTSGEVVYAITSFGGFLGIGEKYHPLPWQVLRYDTNKDGYVVDMTKDKLMAAPAYSHDELSGDDRQWRTKVFDYYDQTPYWG